MLPIDPPAPRSRRERRLASRRASRRLWWPAAALVGAFGVLPMAALGHAEQPAAPATIPAQVIAPAATDQRTEAAPSVAAPRPATDVRFLDELDAHGVSYPSREDAVATAHRVCTFLGRGGTPAGARLLALPRGTYDEDDARAVVDAARDAYCAGGARR